MPSFVVSANQLSKKKDELTTQKNKFEKQVKELQAKAEALNSMWDGEAKQKYQTSIKMDIQKLLAFVTALIEIIKILSSIIDLYNAMERKNVATASGH